MKQRQCAVCFGWSFTVKLLRLPLEATGGVGGGALLQTQAGEHRKS